jgi:predicted HTH transcriptional regulator
MLKRSNVLVQHGTRGGAYYSLKKEESMQQGLFPIPQLSDNEAKVIAYIKTNGYITNSLCRGLLSMDDKDAVHYLLTSMHNKALIKRSGKNRHTRYTV